MSEAQEVRILLALRAKGSGAYDSSVLDGEADVINLHLLDADVAVFIGADSGGRVSEALTFLSRSGSHQSAHLNGWRRPDNFSGTAHDLVDSIWAAFWEHEKENELLGRILWMHGPVLPPTEATQVRLDFNVVSVVEDSEDLDSFFASLSEPVVVEKLKEQKVQGGADVFDLFGE